MFFSFASEYPYRIDFFGDEVDSIRTFEVENQLSKEKKQSIAIVPELTKATDRNGVSFFGVYTKGYRIGNERFPVGTRKNPIRQR